MPRCIASSTSDSSKPPSGPVMIAADEMFHLTKEELEKTMDPSKYTGRASVQVGAFLKNVVNPVLEANKEALGMTAEINV